MKKDELYQLSADCTRDILQRNQEIIRERIASVFKSGKDDSKMSTQDAIAAATALSLTLVPEISAAATAQLLVKLGLVKLEDAE